MFKKIVCVCLAVITIFSALCITSVSAANERFPTAYWTPSLKKSALTKVEKRAVELVGDISPVITGNYEKTLYAYMRLTDFMSYNMGELDSSDAYGALVNGWAQCDGMSAALAYLLKKLNVPVKIVVSPNMQHVWNLVKLDDGKWYHIDCLRDKKILFVGDKTLKKYYGSHCMDYYVCDGSAHVPANSSDYTGGTKLYNSSVVLHEKFQADELYVSNGAFYYNYFDNYYSTIRKVCGNNDKLVLSFSDFSKITPTMNEFEIIDICGDNLYHFESSDNCEDDSFRDCYRYNTKTNELTYEGEITVKDIFAGQRLTNFYHYTHNVKTLATEVTNVNYRTKGRIVCTDCGKVFREGKRIKPEKITAKPVLKLSFKKTKRISYKLTNKFYKATSNIEWFKSRGGYEIAYRLKGKKRWNYEEYFSSKKDIAKNIKVYSKGKYEVKARYMVTYGATYYNYYRKNHYGPWSKIKTIRVKK